MISSFSPKLCQLLCLLPDSPLSGPHCSSSLSFPSLTSSSEEHSQSNPLRGVDRCIESSSVWLPSVEATGARLCAWSPRRCTGAMCRAGGRARAEHSREGGLKGGGRGGDRRRTPESKGVPSRLQQGYKNFLRLFFSFYSCFLIASFLSFFLDCLQTINFSLWVFFCLKVLVSSLLMFNPTFLYATLCSLEESHQDRSGAFQTDPIRR